MAWYDSLGESLGGAWDSVSATAGEAWDGATDVTGDLWDEASAGAKEYANAWTKHEVDKLKTSGQEGQRDAPAVQPSGRPVAYPQPLLQPMQRQTWLMVGGVIAVTIIVILLLFLLLK